MQLSREALLRAYSQMKIIREFEERLHIEIMTGEMFGALGNVRENTAIPESAFALFQMMFAAITDHRASLLASVGIALESAEQVSRRESSYRITSRRGKVESEPRHSRA